MGSSPLVSTNRKCTHTGAFFIFSLGDTNPGTGNSRTSLLWGAFYSRILRCNCCSGASGLPLSGKGIRAMKMVVDKSAEKSDNYVSGNHSTEKPKAIAFTGKPCLWKRIFPNQRFFRKSHTDTIYNRKNFYSHSKEFKFCLREDIS